MTNIAIIDSGHQWSITPVVRELIKKKYNVYLCVQEKKASVPHLFPKIKGHIQIPRKLDDNFISFLAALFNRLNISHMICLDEDIKYHIIKYKAGLIDFHFAHPNIENYQKVSRKNLSIKFAEKLGIPIPRIFEYEGIDDIIKMNHQFNNKPLVVKGVGGVSSLQVRYAFNVSQLREYYDEIKLLENDIQKGDSHPIIQEYIGGPTYLTQTMSQNGKVKSIVSHRKIREWPLTGGVTSRAVTIYEPKLDDYATRMLEALQWHGEAGFEWKYSKAEDDFYFIEMNPRFEGSLDIAVKAGVNFPIMLIKIMENKELFVDNSYINGLHYRWFFRLDFKHFLTRPYGLMRLLWESIDPRVHGEFTFIELLRNYYLLKIPITELKNHLINISQRQSSDDFSVYT